MTVAGPAVAPPALPAELRGWNWGAFLLTWVWGIGNNTYRAFLVFVPVVGLVVMPFVLGAKGSAWAWHNGTWTDAAHFRRVQRRWAIAGLLVWASLIPLGVLAFVGIQSLLTGSEPYRLGMDAIAADARLADRLGRPIGGGTAQGSISTSGGGGDADLDFGITGPKGGGRAALTAHRALGTWTVTALRVRIDGGSETIDVVPADRTGAPP